MCEYFLSPNFNSVCAWDAYTPDETKPYSIINTDNKEGVHWLGAFFKGKTVYVYDSFARNMKHIMEKFYNLMKSKNYKLVFVNKRKNQAENQINCGLRAFVFIVLTHRYGISQSKNI